MTDRIVSYIGDEYHTRTVHNLLLNMLEKFDEHCKHYGINYSLAYGSMLGCVRNKGFIPWDDDVDVVMKRDDYDRFFKSLEEKKTRLAEDGFVKMPLFLPKLHDKTSGSIPVYIDIYAADNVPDNIIKNVLKLCSIQFIKEIIKGRCNHLPGIIHMVRKVVAYGLSFPFSVDKLRRLYLKACISDNHRSTKRMGSYCTGHKSMGKYYPSETYSHFEYIDFECMKLPVIKDYDMYLRKEYGDNYMVPIDVAKRVHAHVKSNSQNK